MKIFYNSQTGLFEVDPLNDFVNQDGALYVPGSNEIKENIRKISQTGNKKGYRAFGTSDRHFYSDEEISDNPNYTDTFNAHCMDRTKGQKRIYGLANNILFVENKINEKGDIRIYSEEDLRKIAESENNVIFEKQTTNVESNPYFKRLMGMISQDEFIVYGVATDYCVKATVSALMNAGKKVILVSDAIKGITPEGEKRTLEEMVKAGARFVTTKQILEEKLK